MPGTLTHSPSRVIRQLLIDTGIGTVPSANAMWPIFVGNEPDKPDAVITVYEGTTFHSGRDSRGEVSEHYGIRIRLRASEYDPGWSKLNEIKEYLDHINNVLVTVPTYETPGGVEIIEKTYKVHAFTRKASGVGANVPFHLGKERQQNSPTDIVFTSQREIFTFSGRVSIRQV